MQKRIGERKRRDNMRRRARHKYRGGIYECAGCKEFYYRSELHIHHQNYKGYDGKIRLLCKKCHAKTHRKKGI